MRLPDDYEDHGGGLTPTVISAIVAVTIFVAVILTVVLIMNRQPTSHQQNNTAAQTENVQQAENNQTDKYPDTQDLITGSTLTPSDLDFWDMYPETTATPLPSAEPSQKDNKKETAEADPSTDGKHTLVTNRDGKEEWVLISPYLPKHEYDFTKLVCQSDLMKYYQDGKLTSYVGVDISKYQDYVDFLKLKKAGVDFVKTSTGFGTAGATVHDVALMRRVVGPTIGVKAAGGIRDLDSALALIQAGATRLGTSSGIQIVESYKELKKGL